MAPLDHAGIATSSDQVIKVQPLSTEDLTEIVRAAGQSLVLVVLNACYSERQAKALAEHVPCVVGMSGAIGDKSAIVYSRSLYRALASGRSVADAHSQGAAALGRSRSDIRIRDVASQRLVLAIEIPRILTRSDIDASLVYIVCIPRSRCVVVIKMKFSDLSAELLAQMTESLRRWSGDVSLKITDIEEGSVKLKIALSSSASKKLVREWVKGDLSQICGHEIVALFELPLTVDDAHTTLASSTSPENTDDTLGEHMSTRQAVSELEAISQKIASDRAMPDHVAIVPSRPPRGTDDVFSSVQPRHLQSRVLHHMPITSASERTSRASGIHVVENIVSGQQEYMSSALRAVEAVSHPALRILDNYDSSTAPLEKLVQEVIARIEAPSPEPLNEVVARCSAELESYLEIQREPDTDDRGVSAEMTRSELSRLLRLLQLIDRADAHLVIRQIRRVLGRLQSDDY